MVVKPVNKENTEASQELLNGLELDSRSRAKKRGAEDTSTVILNQR